MRPSATPRAGSPARNLLYRVIGSALVAFVACSRQEVDLAGRACPEGVCAAGYVCISGSCCVEGDAQCVITDTDPPICTPTGPEICNGVDDDCDGRIDDVSDLPGCTTYYVDADRDAYGTSTVAACHCGPPATGESANDDDCNDDDEDINPGATEIVDGVDNNCDGKVDPCAVDCDCGPSLLACYTLDSVPPEDGGPNHIAGVTIPDGADMARPGIINNAYLISSATKSGAYSNPAFYHAGDATLMAWVNLTELSGNQATVRYIADVQSAQVVSFRGNGALRCAMRGNVIETDAGVLTTGTWIHVACTYANNRIRIYTNGNLVTSQEIVALAPPNEGPFCFGERHNGLYDCDTGSAMTGLLDHIQLFSERLSDERVCYASGNPDCIAE